MRTLSLLCVIALCALLLATGQPIAIAAQSSAPLAADSCDGNDGVYLYAETQYLGACVRFTADSPDLSELSFNNVASSIRFVGDWTATLFVDQNYGGASSSFTRDDPDLSNNNIGDNRASAIRVQKGGLPSGNICDGQDGIYLFEHPQYQGRCVKFTSDAPDLRVFGFDDSVSSIRILGDWTATLYRDLSRTGIASAFGQDDPDVSNDSIGDNQATSLRAEHWIVLPVENRCDGGEGAYLYEHPQYQGHCLKLTGDALDLRTLGFDDAVSSVRILGNWTVTLYRDLYGTGIPSTFTQSDPDVGDNAIGDNQATSAQVGRR
ncbi:MAG TPA: beta/gamma crystallin-related protein [Roseiflexaceae bacterium]